MRQQLLQELGNSFSAIARKVIASKGSATYLISPALDKIILVVGLYDQVRIKELAGLLDITSGAITQEVISLENDDYLARSANPADRRETFVQLTAKGQAALKKIQSSRLKQMTQIFVSLSDTELQELTVLLNHATNTTNKEGTTK